MKWMFNVKNALNSENGSAIDIRFTFNPIITLYSGYMSVLYISSTHPLMLLISSFLLSSTQMWWGSARCAVCSLLIRVIKITHSYALKDVTMANPVQNLSELFWETADMHFTRAASALCIKLMRGEKESGVALIFG